MKNTFRTTAAYFSGAICGEIWWPAGALCGHPVQFDIRSWDEFGNGAGATFEAALDNYLLHNGGDFQSARFAEDSELVIERHRNEGAGTYSVHVRRIPVAKICPDLVRPDTFASDFFGDD